MASELLARWADCWIEEVTEPVGTEILLRVSGRRARLRVESALDAAEAPQPGDVADLAVWNDGALEIRVGAGRVNTILPDSDFEAWTLTFDDHEMFVCGPGGAITSWPADRME